MARQNSVPTLKHRDGMSSDDEEAESETIAYYEEREKIEEDSKQLFADVLEDYSSLKFVAKNLEEWRNKSYSSYKDAYVSHCLPRLLGPFVILELINWNPFQEVGNY
jgi:GC-rich sequence DNA-binding factor